MSIPFAPGARAYFHACRTARWFAPFFARTFGVPRMGTTATPPSRRRPIVCLGGAAARGRGAALPDRLRGKEVARAARRARKYLGARVVTMQAYEPEETGGDTTYDAVATLYDRAFADIRVRRDEWRWLHARLIALVPRRAPARARHRLRDGSALARAGGAHRRPASASTLREMIERAAERTRAADHLQFQAIDGPALPFATGSFDLVTSFLSFRYLDWDPMLQEMRRVLAPGGHLDRGHGRARARLARRRHAGRVGGEAPAARGPRPAVRKRRRRATGHPAWKTMLEYNPIRAEHEYRWYLESRFPGAAAEPERRPAAALVLRHRTVRTRRCRAAELSMSGCGTLRVARLGHRRLRDLFARCGSVGRRCPSSIRPTLA